MALLTARRQRHAKQQHRNDKRHAWHARQRLARQARRLGEVRPGLYGVGRLRGAWRQRLVPRVPFVQRAVQTIWQQRTRVGWALGSCVLMLALMHVGQAVLPPLWQALTAERPPSPAPAQPPVAQPAPKEQAPRPAACANAGPFAHDPLFTLLEQLSSSLLPFIGLAVVIIFTANMLFGWVELGAGLGRIVLVLGMFFGGIPLLLSMMASAGC